MHTDLILFLVNLGMFLVGFVAGRIEKKDSYTRTYRHGFNIGKQVGRNER